MTLKESYLEQKAKYIALAKLDQFSFVGNYRRTDHRKPDRYWADQIRVENSSDEVNKYLAEVITTHQDYLLKKVKAKITENINAFKSNYKASIIAYEAAVTSGEVIPDSTARLLSEFKELRNSLAKVEAIEAFEVTSSMEGVTIRGGFSALNGLIIEVLNDEIALLLTKYKEAVIDGFNAYKTDLSQQVDELKVAINK